MTLSHETNAAMLKAAARADSLYAKLLKARARNANPLLIAGLERAYDQMNQTVNQLWDAWNDAMLRERLARI